MSLQFWLQLGLSSKALARWWRTHDLRLAGHFRNSHAAYMACTLFWLRTLIFTAIFWCFLYLSGSFGCAITLLAIELSLYVVIVFWNNVQRFSKYNVLICSIWCFSNPDSAQFAFEIDRLLLTFSFGHRNACSCGPGKRARPFSMVSSHIHFNFNSIRWRAWRDSSDENSPFERPIPLARMIDFSNFQVMPISVKFNLGRGYETCHINATINFYRYEMVTWTS